MLIGARSEKEWIEGKNEIAKYELVEFGSTRRRPQ
jgi:hypothetical protein